VRRLGHEVIFPGAEPGLVDAVIVEPAAAADLALARRAQVASGAAVVCVSIYPTGDEALALEPVAYLMKPFSLLDLERALLSALERGRAATAA